MTHRLEIEAVVKTIENAFAPFDCGVEVFDYDQKVRFRVFDPEGKALLRVSEALMSRARNPDGLRYMIDSARTRLESKDYVLRPWKIAR